MRDIALDSLRDIVESSRAQGARAGIVILPPPDCVDRGVAIAAVDPNGTIAAVRQVCVEADAACLDLMPDLRAAESAEGGLYFARDRHWTAVGNRVTAEVLADAIIERGLLAP